MKKILPVLCLLLMNHPARGEATTERAIAEANNRFSLDLYGQMQGESGNLAFSPYSVSSALAMTYAGARGQTEQEMAHVLHLPFGQDGTHAASAALRRSLLEMVAVPGGTLSVANRLWGQDEKRFLEPFLHLTHDAYGAELAQLDFINKTEDARRRINEWTLEQTRSMIPDLLQPGVITDLTRLVLTNAIYFKARWQEPFEGNATHDESFYPAPAETLKVPMMRRMGRYPYSQMNGAKLLVMHYTGKRSAMVIVLPESIDGLAGVEADLLSGKLDSSIEAARDADVYVSIPRFRVTSTFSLKGTLSSLGMASAFDQDKADFSGMDGNRDLFISEVVHKTVVDVAEKGTEAAAATAVVMTRGEHAVPEHPVLFTANHPFLFLIRDMETGCVLFIGRVINPKA